MTEGLGDAAAASRRVDAWRREGLTVGFVPTMGALHEGHLSLVRAAKRRCDRAIVSIFVNPLQFAPGEDFESYPRDFEGDLARLATADCDAAFTATAEQMYPEGFSTYVVEDALATTLEGESRPTHFRGVLTVVCKLFHVARPDVAFFGQKDAQQALLIRRMVRDLDFPLEVSIEPTVREPDGLAMSSRNSCLDDEQRQRALALSRALAAARATFDAGERSAAAIHAAADEVLAGTPGVEVDYLEVRDATSLAPVEVLADEALVLVAARVGRTRLIDNSVLGERRALIPIERSEDHVVVLPPAKLNLYLDVLRRRSDGFHELETIMHAIDLFDRLTVRRVTGEAIRLESTGRPCPVGPENLVVRAAEAFFSSSRSRFGIEAELKKNIPLGAGLGGGSADAAGMLVALDQLADSPLGTSRLQGLAAGLGSDVPFFVTCGESPTAVATGRGERIETLPPTSSPHATFVVYYPGTNVETASVYRGLNLDLTRAKNDLKTAVKTLAFGGSDGVPEFHNSLAEPFRELHPDLAALLDRASDVTERPFQVTGSGSAMFTVVADRNEAEGVRRRLRSLAVGESFVCESLPGPVDREVGGKP